MWPVQEQKRPRAIKPGQVAAKAVKAIWRTHQVEWRKLHGATRLEAKDHKKGSPNSRKEKVKDKAVGEAKAHRAAGDGAKLTMQARRATNEPVRTGAMRRNVLKVCVQRVACQ